MPRITAIETAIPHGIMSNLLLLRVHTDDGLVGCGETYYTPHAVAALIHDWMAPRLIAGDLAEQLVAEGYKAVKFWPFDRAAHRSGGLHMSWQDVEEGMKPLRAMRDRVGMKLDIAIEGHAFFHEDELSNVEAQVGRLCTSTEWEVCVRLLGSAAPYLVHGTPPSPSLLDQACWASSTAGSGWAQVHFCHGEAGWERRGGPGLFWPFQDRTEWLLTVPSVLVAAADLSIDTCVVRPSRRL